MLVKLLKVVPISGSTVECEFALVVQVGMV